MQSEREVQEESNQENLIKQKETLEQENREAVEVLEQKLDELQQANEKLRLENSEICEKYEGQVSELNQSK